MSFHSYLGFFFLFLGGVSTIHMLYHESSERVEEKSYWEKGKSYWYRTVFFYFCSVLIMGFPDLVTNFENSRLEYRDYVFIKLFYVFLVFYTPYCFFKSSLFKSK